MARERQTSLRVPTLALLELLPEEAKLELASMAHEKIAEEITRKVKAKELGDLVSRTMADGARKACKDAIATTTFHRNLTALAKNAIGETFEQAKKAQDASLAAAQKAVDTKSRTAMKNMQHVVENAERDVALKLVGTLKETIKKEVRASMLDVLAEFKGLPTDGDA